MASCLMPSGRAQAGQGVAGIVLLVRGLLYHGPEGPVAENPLPARSLTDR
jgi:hypothetical protein